MQIFTLSTAALLSLGLSAGLAAASTELWNETDDGDLGGPFDSPDEDFGLLVPGEHFTVNGVVGPAPVNSEELDQFGSTTLTPFVVTLLDFELVPDNPNTSFKLEQGTVEIVTENVGFGTGNLFGVDFAAGSYLLGAIESTQGIEQPYHLRIATAPAPSEVPLPAGAWLLVGGVAALGAAKAARRRRG